MAVDNVISVLSDEQALEAVVLFPEWKIDTTMRYFRVVIIDAEGNRAWCQPVFVEELLDQGIL